MREFILHDGAKEALCGNGEVKIKVHDDNDCLFCKHCEDVFWDYTNGPYMMICGKQREEVNNFRQGEHTCELFEENDE